MSKVLVRATNWLGDAVMSLPAIRAMRQVFPRAYIAIAARPWVADLYARETSIDRIIPYAERKGLVAALRQERFDGAILLQNAFDAAADLPSDRWVRLDVSAQNHSVVFSVSDNGPGVPPEIKSRIMEPFFTTKPVGKGTGLGLSLSRTIVEEHGGQLKLDDSSTNTTFSFSIPLLMEEKDATQERYNIARG